MIRVLFISLCLLISFSSKVGAAERLLSLDHCMDQWLLGLMPDVSALYVTTDSLERFSLFPEKAKLAHVHGGRTEEILTLKPDQAFLMGWGDVKQLERLKASEVRVEVIPMPERLEAVTEALEALVPHLPQPNGVADALAALAAYHKPEQKVGRVLYLSPSGVTSGRATFVGDLIEKAGYQNYFLEAVLSGWGSVDLEQLIMDPPDIIVASFFDVQQGMADSWRLGRHPAFKALIGKTRFVHVPSSMISCPTWRVTEAIELIAGKKYDSLADAIQASYKGGR